MPRAVLTLFVLVAACGGEAENRPGSEASGAETAAPETGREPNGTSATTPHPLPAEIRGDIVLPGAPPDRHLSATVTLGALPWTLTGCVTPGAAACEETSRVELDDAARAELVALVEEVRAIPRCEPDGIFPDDRPFTLTLTGMPGPYASSLPGDASAMATRNEGPCRASSRLAWWIAQHFPGAGTSLPLPPAVES